MTTIMGFQLMTITITMEVLEMIHTKFKKIEYFSTDKIRLMSDTIPILGKLWHHGNRSMKVGIFNFTIMMNCRKKETVTASRLKQEVDDAAEVIGAGAEHHIEHHIW